jgi:hypothetical protein
MEVIKFTLLFCSYAECPSLLRQRLIAAGNGLGTGLGTTVSVKDVRP